MGVVQNQPPRPPGVAKRASSAATARSAVATSWHPAPVARPWTRATTGCGTACTVAINSAQTREEPAHARQVALDHVAEIVSGAEHRTAAGQDDGARVARPHLTERDDQLLHVIERQRVAAIGPVHGDGRDRVVALAQHIAVVHGLHLAPNVLPAVTSLQAYMQLT